MAFVVEQLDTYSYEFVSPYHFCPTDIHTNVKIDPECLHASNH